MDGTREMFSVCFIPSYSMFPFLLHVWMGEGAHIWVGCLIRCYQSILENPLWFDIFKAWFGLPVGPHPISSGELFVSRADPNKQKFS